MQRVKPEDQDADIASQLLHMVRIARKSAPGKDVIFSIQTGERRSGAQNDFMWPLLRQIGDYYGDTDPENVKKGLSVKRYGERFKEIAGVRVQVYPRTSAFTVDQMRDWLEFILKFAADEGIPLKPPPGMEDYLR